MSATVVRFAQKSVSWPMTAHAAAALRAEIRSLEDELAALRAGTSRVACSERLAGVAVQRLGALRDVLDRARITSRPDVVVIGRRVTIETDDDESARFRLVLPADGDPDRGWLGADTPLGMALLERRAGDRCTVLAPGGTWEARIVDVG